MPSRTTERPKTAAVRYELSNRTLFSVLAAVASIWLLAQIWGVVLIILGALILAGTLNPLVGALQRRGITRPTAVSAIFAALLATLALALLLIVPPLMTQLSTLTTQTPSIQARIADQLALQPWTHVVAEPIRRFKPTDLLAKHEDEVLAYSTATVVAVASAATILALAFYLLFDPTRYLHLLFAAVPRAHHVKVATILARLETIVGGYMRGQLITSGLTSVFVLCLLLACGIAAPMPIALLAGVFDVLPFVGGLISAIPATLAAMEQGPQIALVVLGAILVFQEFESRVLVPRIYGRTLRLPPGAIVVALLIGGSLLGIPGALLALPVAAAIVMLTEELRVVMPGLTTDFAEERKLDERAARAYEERSVGAVANEAPIIAAAVASEIIAVTTNDDPA